MQALTVMVSVFSSAQDAQVEEEEVLHPLRQAELHQLARAPMPVPEHHVPLLQRLPQSPQDQTGLPRPGYPRPNPLRTQWPTMMTLNRSGLR